MVFSSGLVENMLQAGLLGWVFALLGREEAIYKLTRRKGGEKMESVFSLRLLARS